MKIQRSKKLDAKMEKLTIDHNDYEIADRLSDIHLFEDEDFFEDILKIVTKSIKLNKPIYAVNTPDGTYYFVGDEKEILSKMLERLHELEMNDKEIKKDEVAAQDMRKTMVKNIKAKLTKEELAFLDLDLI